MLNNALLRNETVEKNVMIKVPVDVLADSEGIVAIEVKSQDGEIILPAGADLSRFQASLNEIVRKLKRQGTDSVYLYPPTLLSEEDIEEVIENVYSEDGALIDEVTTQQAVKGVRTLFAQASEESDLTPESITPLIHVGEEITENLLRNPSVAFSLRKVRKADTYTYIHSFNVAIITGYLANRLYPDNRTYVYKAVMGGLLHDLGKAKIPPDILNKPGTLSPTEFKTIQRHPPMGVELAIKAGISDRDVLAVIGGHHEKWSGQGYPKMRKGPEIPEAARIAAVADVFDALTAKRAYKDPTSSRNAISIIMKDSGIHFDTRVVRELLTSIGLYPPGSLVSLSDGRIGVVVSSGGADLVRPIVMVRSTVKSRVPTLVNLKSERELCITKYLGHGNKRDLDEIE